MLLRPSRPRRPAATLVEAGLAFSVMFLLTLGTVIFAMGIYYYQQVASLAREGARWASVHGAQYAADTGNAMATQSTIQSNAIVPMAAGLDTSRLTTTASWDYSSEAPVLDDSSGNVVTNYVTVTVSYSWRPLLYMNSMTLTSTSVMPMQY
jgi:Flp pilus assembly protein TadG